MNSLPQYSAVSLVITACLAVSQISAQVAPTPDSKVELKKAEILKQKQKIAARQIGGKPRQLQVIKPTPNSWFESTKMDLGTFLEGEVAIGKFNFKNPNSQTHRLSNFAPNCQCAKAKIRVGGRDYVIENEPVPNTIFRIEGGENSGEKTKVKHVSVAAGEEGYIEMHLNLKNVTGYKEAFVALRTDDPKLNAMNVSARARGVKFFTVVPPQVNLNKMTWNEQREFSVEVSSDVKPEFEVVGIEPTVPGLEVTSQAKSMRNGKSIWKIEGTYGPNVAERAGGGVLKVKTDIRDPNQAGGKIVEVRVIAMVEGPMTVRPGTFLPLGRIKQKSGTSKVVEFEGNGDFDLQFGEITFENVSGTYASWLSHEISKEGKVLKLAIKVAPNAPRGLLRGDVRVALNHPGIEAKTLQFNGFVR